MLLPGAARAQHPGQRLAGVVAAAQQRVQAKPLKLGSAPSLSEWQVTTLASSRMQITPSSILSATRTPGIAPCRATIAAHAWRRAAFTALVIRACARGPPAGDLAQRPPGGGHRGDQAMQVALISQDPEVADHLRAVRDRAGQVRGDPAPVMDQQPLRGQRL